MGRRPPPGYAPARASLGRRRGWPLPDPARFNSGLEVSAFLRDPSLHRIDLFSRVEYRILRGLNLDRIRGSSPGLRRRSAAPLCGLRGTRSLITSILPPNHYFLPSNRHYFLIIFSIRL